MATFIDKFWNSQAEKKGHLASWGDKWAVSLEINEISKHIQDGDEVLDVGCANGFSAIAQTRLHHINMVGVDYSPAMIAAAPRNNDIRWEVGDVRNLQFPDNAFDVVYTTRTLINLQNWEEQKQGIRECLRVCRHGGKVMLSEAFWEPLQLLNAMRLLVKLPPLVEHDFNRYLKKSKLESFLKDLKYEVDDFSSVYYLGSRFLRELVTNTEDYPGYSNPVNKDFFNLEMRYSGGWFGIQQAYIIQK